MLLAAAQMGLSASCYMARVGQSLSAVPDETQALTMLGVSTDVGWNSRTGELMRIQEKTEAKAWNEAGFPPAAQPGRAFPVGRAVWIAPRELPTSACDTTIITLYHALAINSVLRGHCGYLRSRLIAPAWLD
jgi:hypothetical protein